jgi:hypothetical protein
LVLFGVGAYALFAFPLRLYKSLAWNINEGSANQQFETMFLRNPYNPNAGTEDFNGMVTRFFDNIEIYISKHLPIILGLRPEKSNEQSMFLAIVISLVLIAAFVISYKKNKKIFFVATATIGGITATFITQQVFWGQSRLILIFMPFILVMVTWLVMYLSATPKLKHIKTVLLLALLFIFFKTLGVSLDKIDNHEKNLKKNLKGDMYAGFTQDWENFLRMSEWASENVPDTVVIGSRKPSMSFIYGDGREFYGVYKFLMYDAQELMTSVKEKYGDIIALEMKQLQNKSIKREFRYLLGRSNVGFVYDKSENYILINKNGATGNVIKQQLQLYNIAFDSTYNDFYSKIEGKIGQLNSTSSDSLLHHLYQHDVEYLIRASLRVNPQKKTDRTINTVARYIYYIELKYPGIFKISHQIGKKEDEPAYLIKLNYDTYKINDDSFK